jgi:DNA-binding response OmpR family regulator
MATEKPDALLVDDDPFILSSVRRHAEAESIPLRYAATAEEAVRLVEEDPPSVLVTDYRMPGMDGLTLIDRAREKNPKMLCLLHTGEAMHRVMMGLDVPVVSKPCPPEVLLGIIRDLLGFAARGK